MIILDRFEGELAVLEEDGAIKNVPRALLEEGISEGDVIVKKADKYFLDKENSAIRRKKIAELQNRLFED